MNRLAVLVCLVLQAGLAAAGNLVVSPTGTSAGAGTVASPLDVASALLKVQAGDTILVQEGTYRLSSTLLIDSLNNGSEGKRKCLVAAKGSKPVFDYADQPYAAAQRGILLRGSWWLIKGLEICFAGDNGIKIEGNRNRIENCVLHHNRDAGLQLGFAHETVNVDGLKCAYNEIVNCDSYLNFDPDTKGGNADGFACKMHNGKGNVFRGCRAWRNSDDGWDLYETDWSVAIDSCWAWHNGDQTDFDSIYLAMKGTKMSSFSGNGNGIKLGGNGTGGDSKGQHVVTNCVAFNNRFRSLKGFDQNSHKGGVILRNCTAWNNGYNYMFETEATTGSSNEFANNVSFSPKSGVGFEFTAGSVLKNNSWQIGVLANAADFRDTTEAGAQAARQADGSLPANGFARLVSGSDLANKGVDVGLPWLGTAPDLGAFELDERTLAIGQGASGRRASLRADGEDLVVTSGRAVRIRLRDAQGHSVRQLSAQGERRIGGALLGLGRGMWLAEIEADGVVSTERFVRP